MPLCLISFTQRICLHGADLNQNYQPVHLPAVWLPSCHSSNQRRRTVRCPLFTFYLKRKSPIKTVHVPAFSILDKTSTEMQVADKASEMHWYKVFTSAALSSAWVVHIRVCFGWWRSHANCRAGGSKTASALLIEAKTMKPSASDGWGVHPEESKISKPRLLGAVQGGRVFVWPSAINLKDVVTSSDKRKPFIISCGQGGNRISD